MFPFVGAPMFYSARRRKRKWTLVFAADGAVAISDIIRAEASSTAITTGEEETVGGSGGGDELEGTSFGGGESTSSIATTTCGQGGGEALDVGVASEVLILLPSSSSLVALTSTPASLELANLASSPLTNSPTKKRLRRSSSVPSRGGVRPDYKTGGDRACVPSNSSAKVYADEAAVSALECLLEHCAKWNFDVFLLNRLSGGHAVVSLGCKIFQTYQFHRVFQLDWAALLLCLRLIENGYRENPYHNSEHAADVAQAMHCFLQEPALAAALDPLEKMACILAAFGHDLYHPGVNQKFLEANDHFLCRLYNRVSVLENFHWRCLVRAVKESSLLDHLAPESWQKLLKIFEVLILATDMQRQQEYLNQFKPLLERGGQPHLNDADERLFVMQILIKCADIANPCRPWTVSKEWSFRASTEFFLQGDEERRLGLPVTNFCDRFATSVPKIQSGFMEYVAQPLFADWDQYMRSPLSSYMLRNLRINCQNWNKTLRDQVHQQELSLQQRVPLATANAPMPSSSSLVRLSPGHQVMSASSSLEEMAELEMQKPDVLQKRRASSSALPRSRSPRSSFQDLPRRVSLPVATSGGATLWTASANRRVYEAISSSDLANAPIRLRLSHSEVAEESDDEDNDNDASRHEAIEEGEETEEGQRMVSDDPVEGERPPSGGGGGGACTGSGCGTPTPPPSLSTTVLVSKSATDDALASSGLVYSFVDKRFGAWMASTPPPPQQQERRYSEPLVFTFANFCSTASSSSATATASKSGTSSSGTKSKQQQQQQQSDENGLLSNLMLLQRCMPRRGSLPMTQKELEDVQAINGDMSLVPAVGGTRSSNSSVPETVPTLGRFVGVS